MTWLAGNTARVIVPGLGRKSASGSSAFTRTSIAWPASVTSACFSRSGRPSAIASCSATMSMPVTASVTGCSTWTRALTSRK